MVLLRVTSVVRGRKVGVGASGRYKFSLDPADESGFDAQEAMARERLDRALVDRGLLESREKAKRLIMAGEVRVNGHVANKASDWVRGADAIEVATAERFVSRGGFKLQGALDHFRQEVDGIEAIDFGASTGGFTDCLLQYGASRVYAIDVGQAQLAWKLRQDERVVVMEKQNARHLTPQAFGGEFCPVGLLVADCSFISLTKLIPAMEPLVRSGGKVIALIKPQFEAGKAEVDRGRGVIRDESVRLRVVEEIRAFVEGRGVWVWEDFIESPIEGPSGNREYLARIERA